MMTMKTTRSVLLVLFSLQWQSSIQAEDSSLVADLYANPPVPCKASGVSGESSLLPINPAGSMREGFIGIMGSLASIFLAEGAHHMAAGNIEAAYTAVFFEEEPVNEVGIYAYKFRGQIDQSMFSPRKELGAKSFVIGRNLLVLLWREQSDRTLRCFSALDRIISEKP